MFVKKGFGNPTKFPAVFHFSAPPALNFDVLVADEPAFIGLKMNVRSIDGPSLKTLKSSRPQGQGVSVEDLKTVLVEGATWRSPKPPLQNDPDGAKTVCAICENEKQPVKFSFTDKESGETEERGNFMELKAEKLEALKESDPELLVAAEEHTREIIGPDAVMPKFVRTLFVCEGCKEAEKRRKVYRTYYSRETIADRLFERNTRIQAAVRRNALNDVLGSKRSDPRARQDAYQKYGVASERRGGNRNRPDRPEKPKAVFSASDGSAEFETGTVEAFAKAGVTTLAEIAAASNERLAQIGAISSVDHEPAAKSVRFRAQSALDRAAKAVTIANAANELSIPSSPRGELRNRRMSASRKTGRKGKRFQKKEETYSE